MTQPTQDKGSAGALSRRLGPLPIWVWAIIIGIAVVWFLRRRKGKNSSANSNAYNAPPNVASSGATIFPYPTDIFVSVQDKTPGANDTPGDGDPDTPDPDMPDRTTSVTYTVKPGDNLWNLETKFGIPHGTLYQLNAASIEAAARAHGMGSSNSGHWIFPGTVLTVPK